MTKGYLQTYSLPGVLIISCTALVVVGGIKDFQLIKTAPDLFNLSPATSDHQSFPSPNPLSLNSLNNQASDLFGVPIIENKNNLETLPETTVALVLKGTFASYDGSDASALIAEKSEGAERFFLGEQITDGIELVRVERELVVLRRNNQDEVLRMANFGEINLGPELRYRDRISNRNTNSGVNPVDISELNSFGFNSDDAAETMNSTTNTATNTDRSITRAQERLSRLRTRYSQ